MLIDRLKVCHACVDGQSRKTHDCKRSCVCTIDGREMLDHASQGDCPKGHFAGDFIPLPVDPGLTLRGPELWAELHRWAMVADLSQVAEWLEAFAERLGCGECKQHWLTWVGEHVPATGDHAALLRWTIAGHNAVNLRLGNAERGVEEMVNYWALNGL